jgi:hypothetical protein
MEKRKNMLVWRESILKRSKNLAMLACTSIEHNRSLMVAVQRAGFLALPLYMYKYIIFVEQRLGQQLTTLLFRFLLSGLHRNLKLSTQLHFSPVEMRDRANSCTVSGWMGPAGEQECLCVNLPSNVTAVVFSDIFLFWSRHVKVS